jgi:hypothetical protein
VLDVRDGVVERGRPVARQELAVEVQSHDAVASRDLGHLRVRQVPLARIHQRSHVRVRGHDAPVGRRAQIVERRVRKVACVVQHAKRIERLYQRAAPRGEPARARVAARPPRAVRP